MRPPRAWRGSSAALPALHPGPGGTAGPPQRLWRPYKRQGAHAGRPASARARTVRGPHLFRAFPGEFLKLNGLVNVQSRDSPGGTCGAGLLSTTQQASLPVPVWCPGTHSAPHPRSCGPTPKFVEPPSPSPRAGGRAPTPPCAFGAAGLLATHPVRHGNYRGWSSERTTSSRWGCGAGAPVCGRQGAAAAHGTKADGWAVAKN